MDFKTLEELRKTYHNKWLRISITTHSILIPIFIIVLIIFLSGGNSLGSTLPMLFTLAVVFFTISLVLLRILTRKELEDYRSAYKSYFIASSLSRIFTNISYHHDLSMSRTLVDSVMDTADRYHSNDMVEASYKNIHFAQADVHIEERRETTDSDGHTHTYYATLFKGRFLVFEFNRNFISNLQLVTRHFPNAKLPVASGNLRKFEKIKTESDQFNKTFTVMAQDGVEAFYILDPAFMEKVQSLRDYYSSTELLLTFMNKKLYIALNNNHDSFEPPNPHQPLNEENEFEKAEKDIKVITSFVDSLNLDRYFKSA